MFYVLVGTPVYSRLCCILVDIYVFCFDQYVYLRVFFYLNVYCLVWFGLVWFLLVSCGWACFFSFLPSRGSTRRGAVRGICGLWLFVLSVARLVAPFLIHWLVDWLIGSPSLL